MNIINSFVINYSNLAEKEGWNLFDGEVGLELQRCDESNIFKNDYSVWIHIVSKSLEGSKLHITALDCLKFNNIKEYDAIIKCTNMFKLVKNF